MFVHFILVRVVICYLRFVSLSYELAGALWYVSALLLSLSGGLGTASIPQPLSLCYLGGAGSSQSHIWAPTGTPRLPVPVCVSVGGRSWKGALRWPLIPLCKEFLSVRKRGLGLFVLHRLPGETYLRMCKDLLVLFKINK